jgi:NAD(P)H-dependent FMN reductase
MNTRNTADSRITILGLIGSQRRLGNCELFVKEVSRNIPYPHDLKLVRLPSLNIAPCNGCYRCIEGGSCPEKDDIPFLLREILSSDAVIIAAPVYFLGAHASIKRILDKAFSFYDALQDLEGKSCLLINVFGMKERIGTSPQALVTLAAFLGLTVKGSLNLQAALPGDIIARRKHLQLARKCAGLLIGHESLPRARRSCPFCGSRIIRMRETDFVCTACNGTFRLGWNGRPVKGRPGWDLNDTQFVREHREWLKGMKAHFLAHKREILARTFPYKDIGRWVEPE